MPSTVLVPGRRCSGITRCHSYAPNTYPHIFLPRFSSMYQENREGKLSSTTHIHSTGFLINSRPRDYDLHPYHRGFGRTSAATRRKPRGSDGEGGACGQQESSLGARPKTVYSGVPEGEPWLCNTISRYISSVYIKRNYGKILNA